MKAQTDCLQSNGLHSYTLRLAISEVTSDFSASDFITHITENENPSIDELDNLVNSIIDVYKVFPSVSHHKAIVLTSSSNLLTTLTNYSNTITSAHCRATDCENNENLFRYYVLLSASYLEHSFNKSDFIDFLVENDQISEEEFDFFDENITEVEKYIQFDSQFAFFHRFAIVSSSTELFDIFFNYPNSIEFHECVYACGEYPEDCLLGGETMHVTEQPSGKDAMVYPNPLTHQSVLQLPEGFNGELYVYDLNGKIIHTQNIQHQEFVSLQHISFSTGVYFLKIQNSTTQQIQLIKVVK